MKTQLYAIYDTIAEIFNKPFIEHNDGSAVRAFTDSILDNKNKNDFVLYKIGTYYDGNGEIKPIEPTKIIAGFDIKHNEEYTIKDNQNEIRSA